MVQTVRKGHQGHPRQPPSESSRGHDVPRPHELVQREMLRRQELVILLLQQRHHEPLIAVLDRIPPAPSSSDQAVVLQLAHVAGVPARQGRRLRQHVDVRAVEAAFALGALEQKLKGHRSVAGDARMSRENGPQLALLGGLGAQKQLLGNGQHDFISAYVRYSNGASEAALGVQNGPFDLQLCGFCEAEGRNWEENGGLPWERVRRSAAASRERQPRLAWPRTGRETCRNARKSAIFARHLR
eukprot:scaffold2739_cov257-Pinguiococcus_pyrenoidosus.AAC.22